MAVLIELIALGASVALLQFTPGFQFPEALLIFAIVVAALTWGSGPAVVATWAGVIPLDYLLLPPYRTLAFDHVEDTAGVILVLIINMIVSLAAGQALLSRHRAEEATQRMDEFLSIASHELRAPLTTIKITTQLARRQAARALAPVSGAPVSGHGTMRVTQEELLGRMEVQAERLSRLVDDLVDAARARSAKLELRTAPHDLVTLVREAVEEHRAAHPDRVLALEAPATPVPVVVDGRVRAVLYGGHRVATQFGDSIVRDTLKVSRTLAWELSVADEVDRRLALLETERPELTHPDPLSAERLELRELYAELRELGRAVADPEIARRLDAVGRRILPHGMSVSVPSPLSPRELDMLAQVALGKRNGQIAAQLALTEATVKSYLSTAMRKLNASNRYEAVIAARRAGLIP